MLDSLSEDELLELANEATHKFSERLHAKGAKRKRDARAIREVGSPMLGGWQASRVGSGIGGPRCPLGGRRGA